MMFVYHATVLLLALAFLVGVYEQNTSVRQGFEEWDTGAIMLSSSDTCMASNDRMGYRVNVVFDADMPDAQGKFSNQEPLTITLRETDIDTVSHEVSHLVDYILRDKHVVDDEIEAWLQSAWTDCIYQIVKRNNETKER